MDRAEGAGPKMREGALIAAAIVVASLILSWGGGNSEPRYQLAGSGDSIVRMDTDSGEMIACSSKGCVQVQEPDRTKNFGIVGIRVENSKDKLAPAKDAGSSAP